MGAGISLKSAYVGHASLVDQTGVYSWFSHSLFSFILNEFLVRVRLFHRHKNLCEMVSDIYETEDLENTNNIFVQVTLLSKKYTFQIALFLCSKVLLVIFKSQILIQQSHKRPTLQSLGSFLYQIPKGNRITSITLE